MSSLYIHIPFCRKACVYCDFHFSTNTRLIPVLTDAICIEMEKRIEQWQYHSLDTIYFGGGTPSLLEPDLIARILRRCEALFELNKLHEVTLEANPDDITRDRLKVWKDLGINRLSVGVQSFDDKILKWMNRAHNPQQAIQSMEWAMDAGFESSSVDLIYGFPQLTDDEWVKQLKTIQNLGVRHLSAYNLTIEPRTVLNQRIRKGLDPPLLDDDGLRHFGILQEWIRSVAWEHYEVSNTSQPGYRSRHNSAYWSGKPYLGLGPSAHSYDGFKRRWNLSSNLGYIQKIQSGESYWEEELLNKRDRMNELVMLGLRTMEGLDLKSWETLAGQDLAEMFGHELRDMQAMGWLLSENGFLKLTSTGMAFADHIASRLFVL